MFATDSNAHRVMFLCSVYFFLKQAHLIIAHKFNTTTINPYYFFILNAQCFFER